MCPFSLCDCWKCSLITERTRIMAMQRRLGKNEDDESLPSVGHREAQPQASGGVRYVNIMSDSMNKHDKDTVTCPASTTGRPATPNARTESVIKMPPRKTEPDGKMYAALVPVKSVNESAPKTIDLRDQIPQPTVIPGVSATGIETTRESVRYGGPTPWNAMQDNTLLMSRSALHYPTDDVIAAVAQRDLYSGELMTMPFPFNPFTSAFQIHQPGLPDYGCQAIVVNMPPPPPPPPLGPVPRPGIYGDPPLGYPRLYPSAMPCVSEPGPSQDCRVPVPPPPPTHPPGLQDELLRPPHHPGLHKDKE